MHPSSGGRIPFSTASNETGAKQNFGMTFSQPQFQQFPPYRPSGAHNVNYPSSVQVQHGNPRQSYSQVGGIRLNKLHPTMVHQNVAQNQVHAGKIAEIDQKNRLNYHAEKKKLEQQQKLKAFSKVGVKSSIDADTLMENIIGPVLKPVQTKKIQESNKEEDSFGDFVQCQTVDNKENGPSVEIPEQTKNKNVLPVAPVSASYIPDQNPKKGLDLMMKQCTDLSVSSNKASLFQQKKSLSEVAPAKHKSQQFVPSNKACDWSKVKTDLNVSFAAPPVIQSKGLPDWCSSEKVPAIYHKIEVSVINNMGVIDTGLLYPILMSSGLPQQLLAYIWSLANQTTPGQLTQVELYVALALVAVAQCGYPFQNIDVLNSIPQPPIPNFYSQTSIQQAGPAEIAQENASVENSSLGNSTDVCEQSSSHKTMSTISTSSETGTRQNKDDVHTPAKNIPPLVPPNEIPVGHAITESVSAEVNSDFQVMEGPKRISGNYRRAMLENQPSEIEVANIPGSSLLDIAKRKEEIESLNQEMSKKHDDDDFDNFVSATQPNSVIKNNNNEDFADFKHASRDISSTSVLFSEKATNNVQPVPSDLMSLEHDKYSAFRELDVCNSDQSETDFGDFVNADATAVSNDSVELVNSNQDETSTFQADFTHQIENPSFQADFTNQIEQPSFQADFSLFDNESNPDNEFGDFKSTDQNEILKKSVEKTKSSKKLDPFSTAETQSNSSLELSNFDAAVNMNKDSLSLASLEFDQSLNQSDFKRLKKDNSSLGENQSITSLEFGSFEFGGQSSESSKSPISKSDSTPSLELRVTTTDSASLDANDEFGDMLSAETSLPAENYEITHKKPIDASYVLQNSGNNAFIIDKYSSVRSSEQLEEDTHRSEWYKCLQSCKEILITANSIFNRISSKAVCSEVLSTEEGSSYFKNIIEVYRVVERVAVSINSFKKCNTKIGELLKEINLIWNNLSAFIAGTAIMPEKSSFDFSLGVFSRPDQECTQLACGVCLLHVDAKSKACDLEEDSYRLTYGGRHYHSACANLWVNCVDSILPSLPLPQLL